jgi:hypothetical protein
MVHTVVDYNDCSGEKNSEKRIPARLNKKEDEDVFFFRKCKKRFGSSSTLKARDFGTEHPFHLSSRIFLQETI